MRRLALAAVLTLAVPCFAQKLIEFEPGKLGDEDATRSKGWAVVVGVDSYASDRFSTLRLAVKDATSVGKVLEDQGWTVAYLLSSATDAKARPTKASQVLDKLESMAKLAGPRDRLLFYFSGHGFSVDRVNYLCVGETEFEGHTASALSERDVLRAMEGSRTQLDPTTGKLREETYRVRAQKKLIVLDACRSDGKGGGRRGGFTDKQLAEARGVGHLYATAPGYESYEPQAGTKLDGKELEHSFFTHFFLKGLAGEAESNDDGFVTFLEVVDYVSYELAQRNFRGELREQTPFYLWDGPWGDVLLTRVSRTLPPLVLTLDTPSRDTNLTPGTDVEFTGRIEGGDGTHTVTVNGMVATVNNGTWRRKLRVPDTGSAFLVQVDGVDRGRRAAPRVDTSFPMTRTVEPDPAPTNLTGRHTEVRKFALGAELVYLEPGTFQMGSPTSETDRGSDETQHTVRLTKGFWMWRTELTQGQWKDVMGTEPWKGNAEAYKNATVDDTNHPAVNVSWNDAVAFCEKLTERERRAGRLPTGYVYRLPTEAEWEYACRAGTRTPFSFGGTITTSQVNYDGNYPYAGGSKGQYRQKTVRVGSLPANAWGLHEMHGNVYEWCLDHADWDNKVVTDTYRDGITDPLCQRGSLRVIRGGSWDNNARYCRSALRDADAPDFADYSLGFRPVLARVP